MGQRRRVLGTEMIGPRLACAALVLLGLGIPQVQAQTVPQLCGNRTDVVRHLQTKFGEEQRGRGLSVSGYKVELWASQRGTWTWLVVYPNDTACIMDAGEFWPVKVRGVRS